MNNNFKWYMSRRPIKALMDSITTRKQVLKIWKAYAVLTMVMIISVSLKGYADDRAFENLIVKNNELISLNNDKLDNLKIKNEIKVVEQIEVAQEQPPVESRKVYNEKIMYTTANLNVRTGPGTSFKVTKTLKKGSEVKVKYVENIGNWVLIDDETELYVSSKYLSDVKEVINTSTGYTNPLYPSSSVRGKSGLTKAGVEKILNNYPNMGDISNAVMEIEEMYNINALFTLSVAAHESGYGKSNAARNKHNLFGIMNKGNIASFSSKSKSVYSFGKTINSHFRRGQYTISNIQTTYCPSPASWTNKVSNMSKVLYNKL